MNKEILYKTFFETVNDSVECSSDNVEYSSYINGLCDMTAHLLDELRKEEKNEI